MNSADTVKGYGQIPEGWKARPIREFNFDISDGNYADKYPSQTDFVESGVPFIRSNNIHQGQLNGENLRFISPKLHSELTRGHLKFGDLLITTRGELGKLALVGAEFVGSNINAQLVRINTVGQLDNKYLFYFISFCESYGALKEIETGTALKQLPVNKLKSIEIVFPTDDIEQQKIAKILTTVDNLIEQTQALIDKYTAIKQGMMADLFTRGLDLSGTPQTNPDYGQLRPSYQDAPELYKETELGWVPREWDALLIGETLEKGYLQLIQDGNHGEAYPRSSDFSSYGVPFLSAKHISKDGSIDFEACPKLPPSHLEKLRIGFGACGDVVFAHNATVGPVGIASDEKKFIASTSTTIYRVGNGLLNMYLFYFLRSIVFQHQVLRVMGQTTRNQIPIGSQKEQKIMIPKIHEQKEMIRILEAMRQKIREENAFLNKCQKIKKGLMQDLLTGKVRVTV